MELVTIRKAFYRCDLQTLLSHSQTQAGEYAPSISQHSACAALPLIATFLRSGEVELLTQNIQQGCAWINLNRMCLPVDFQFNIELSSGTY
jgi:hypothetical protein